jgi:hypothetical protein
MTITYEWSFPNFEVDSENKVQTIHWGYTAVDGEYSANMYGSCAGSDGMDFDAMTKEHCISCVLENQEQTEEDMQSNLSAQIEEQKNPETISKTKEW